jgi:hypothetical protein
MRSLRSIALACLAVLSSPPFAAAAATPPFAAAAAATPPPPGWSPARTLGLARGRRGGQNALAIDDHETLAAWTSHSGVWEATVRGSRITRQRVATAPHLGSAPVLVADRRGDAALAWQISGPEVSITALDGFAPGPLFVATRRPGGRFGAPRLIDADAKAAVLGIDAHGTVTLAWVHGKPRRSTRAPQRLEVSTHHAGGGWTRAATITHGRELQPSLAVDASGDALLAWEALGRHSGPQGVREGVRCATRAAGAPFGAPHLLVSSLAGSAGLTSAIDARGLATVAWEGRFLDAVYSPRSIELQTIDTTSPARGRRQTITPPAGRGLANTDQVSLVDDPDGAAALAWSTSPAGAFAPSAIAVARRAPGAPDFAKARDVGIDGPFPDFALAMGAGGRVLVAWARVQRPYLEAAFAPSLGTPLRRTPDPRPTGKIPDEPLAAFDGAGHGVLLWAEIVGAGHAFALARLR